MYINYGFQTIENDDIKAVVKTLKSRFLTQGPEVKKFENLLSNKLGSKHCLVVSSGTAALHLAGKALGWKKNEIIITSPITFLSTVNSIIYNGASPDFVDINKDNYTIDVHKLEKKIIELKKRKKKVKSVIGVDYAGSPCDWKSLKKLSKKYNFTLINDNCHALGAKYFGKINYAVNYADIVVQSFHPVKNITTGEGGALLTNNSKYFNKIKKLRSHGVQRTSEWSYEMEAIGYNYRLPDINCSLGISQLKKLNKFIIKRKKIANLYKSKLNSIPSIKLPNFSQKHISHGLHLFPILIDFKKLKISKENFLLKMLKKNIKLQVHYIPVFKQKFYKKNFNFNENFFPIANKFFEQTVSLPIYPSLSEKDQNKVIKNIIYFLK